MKRIVTSTTPTLATFDPTYLTTSENDRHEKQWYPEKFDPHLCH